MKTHYWNLASEKRNLLTSTQVFSLIILLNSVECKEWMQWYERENKFVIKAESVLTNYII